MHNGLNGQVGLESSLIRLYMEITGASESMARSVFMYVCCREEPFPTPPHLTSGYVSLNKLGYAPVKSTCAAELHGSPLISEPALSYG